MSDLKEHLKESWHCLHHVQKTTELKIFKLMCIEPTYFAPTEHWNFVRVIYQFSVISLTCLLFFTNEVHSVSTVLMRVLTKPLSDPTPKSLFGHVDPPRDAKRSKTSPVLHFSFTTRLCPLLTRGNVKSGYCSPIPWTIGVRSSRHTHVTST